MQSHLLAGIKSELLAPHVVEEVRRYARQSLLGKREDSSDPLQRLRKLEEEVSKFVDAISCGALRALPAIAYRLAHAEDELARLQSTSRAPLRELSGSNRVIGEEQEVRFEADLRETHTAPLRAAGGSANNVVAGGPICPYPGARIRRRVT